MVAVVVVAAAAAAFKESKALNSTPKASSIPKDTVSAAKRNKNCKPLAPALELGPR